MLTSRGTSDTEKYLSDAPEYLRNRPCELVKHCLKKISLTNFTC